MAKSAAVDAARDELTEAFPEPAELARDVRREARLAELVAAEQRRDRKKPPQERRTEKQLRAALWNQAKKDVRNADIKRWIASKARAAAITVAADVGSAAHRNRNQLAPFMIAAPFGVVGLVANLAVTQGTAQAIPAAAVIGLVLGCAAAWLWHKGAGTRLPALSRRVPGRYRAKVQAGLGAGCAWATVMPLLPWTPYLWGMALAWLGATCWLSLEWWREHDHPIPLQASTTSDRSQDGKTPPPKRSRSVDGGYGQEVIDAWAAYVDTDKLLRGSTLTHAEQIEFGWQWRINLVRGAQTVEQARGLRGKIAAALNVPVDRLFLDKDPREGATETSGRLQILTETPANHYDGPRIVRDGGDVYVEIGAYTDGEGCERYHLFSDQLSAEDLAAGDKPRGSIFGGYALGTKGSGKSRLLELLADGLREIGVVVAYLDPQNGKSSPALMAEADMPLAGLHGNERIYGNVRDLLHTIRAVCEVREAVGADAPGFQHCPETPGFVAIIDECHEVFQATNPDTGQTFGADFAELDRKMRKNGVALLTASQSITQDTFGAGNIAAVLRDGLCQENVFILAYSGKNLTLVPGYDGQDVATLPLNRGYGYNPKGQRPHTRFQARYTPDYQPLLAAKPRPDLEPLARKWIGPVWANRFETAHANLEASRAFLRAVATWDGDPRTRPVPPGLRQAEDSEVGGPPRRVGGTSTTTVLSPSQQRAARAAQENHTVAEPVSEPISEPARPQPTAAQQRVLDALLELGASTSQGLADHLRVSRQAAEKHLKALIAMGVVDRHDGQWTLVNS
ncbi:winged helix-turn-helix domain-containing protein [Prauserella sp. PE36]|uniref:winged helix-turn-helix domain-containing protein n=1 Tax=Prauserella sp. PE36 TaxID=1504709 RepID=UPI0011BF3651|nr:winged helix-turn-helix domain-containing protein [Prauserella sp. PE36]